MILSILTPFIERHKLCYYELVKSLQEQYNGGDVELIYDSHETDTTGTKRNRLIEQAKGKYIVFIDADDEVPDYYIEEILKGAESDCDCMAINGVITTNGQDEYKWYISKDNPYIDSVDNDGNKIYLRYPNHITPIKREIAIQVKFPDKFIQEDYEWATEIHKRELIQTEYTIDKPMYHYKFSTIK